MSALSTDLYHLTMLQSYLAQNMREQAVFELFVRKLPAQRNFLVAAGLEQALDYLTNLSFSREDLDWLSAQDRFSNELMAYLAHLRFEGDVDAVPEGTIVFADEPVLRLSAPLPQAQLVESRLLNIIHFQTLIASKAARLVLAASGRRLIDFGMRRAHGAEAALFAARAAYLAGFDGAANAEAGRRFDVPVFGTMAHAFVQAHDSEMAAFESFARAWPDRPTLLVDTYDTEAAVRALTGVASKWASSEGIRLGAVRLDSGDLGAHAFSVRRLLDDAGLNDVAIFASGNLDEQRISALRALNAPIDGFGVGTALDTSSDVPALDAVYKLQVYAGKPRRKRSEGKSTWPGKKQVFRRFSTSGEMTGDVVQLCDRTAIGEPQLLPCLRSGKRTARAPPLAEIRDRCAAQIRSLPSSLRRMETAVPPYEVTISQEIRSMAMAMDARDP